MEKQENTETTNQNIINPIMHILHVLKYILIVCILVVFVYSSFIEYQNDKTTNATTEQTSYTYNGHTYKYKYVLTDRISGAWHDTTYVVLTNRENITFEDAYKMDVFSYKNHPYVDPLDSIIIEKK